MDTIRIVILLEFAKLARQVDGVPEEYPIEVLTPDSSDQPFDERMRDRSVRNRFDFLDFEEAQVGRGWGAHLANAAAAGECTLYYWRERGAEVDFVVRAGRRLVAIEVKSGRAPQAHPGIGAFSAAFRPQRTLLVGRDGIAIDEFLAQPVTHWLQAVRS